MLKRILTAIVGIVLLGVVFVYSDTVLLQIAFGVMALLGVYEMLGCIGIRKNLVVSSCIYAMTVAAVVLTFCIEKHSLFFAVYASLLFCVLTVIFASSVFSEGKIPVDKACIAFTTSAYIITGFVSIILTRSVSHGKEVFLLVFLAPWVTDTFAYFGGRLFGRHKLIPSVSPKKTVEGSICGTLFCTLVCFLYGYGVERLFEKSYPLYMFAVLGFIISAVSQVGDLIFSLIKRRYDIKDYGFIFPGHGGVLDRFDSVISTAPLLLLGCEAMMKFGLMG